MTSEAGRLLEELEARDVALWVDGSEIRFLGPEDVLTKDVRQAITDQKGRLIDLIQRREEGPVGAPRELIPSALIEELDLVVVPRGMHVEDVLSATKPATDGQLRRLWELRTHEELSADTPPVEDRIKNGLSEREAYRLIGELGDRIARARRGT